MGAQAGSDGHDDGGADVDGAWERGRDGYHQPGECVSPRSGLDGSGVGRQRVRVRGRAAAGAELPGCQAHVVFASEFGVGESAPELLARLCAVWCEEGLVVGSGRVSGAADGAEGDGLGVCLMGDVGMFVLQGVRVLQSMVFVGRKGRR
jgi:hypothetical protein